MNTLKKHWYYAASMFLLAIIFSAYKSEGINTANGNGKRDTVRQPDPLHPDYTVAPLKDWEKKFSEFKFNVVTKDGHVLPYRFYAPPHLDPNKKYPLVFFLHGAGERGNDNRLQLMRFNPVAFWEKYPCFILAPQCPNRQPGKPDGENCWVPPAFWGAKEHTMTPNPTWPLRMAMELLDKTIADNPIDHSRIYVTGLSMGGFATWEVLQREPADLFAAAMPVCGGADLSFAPKLAKLPLWIFHGGADSVVHTQRSRDMFAALMKAGGHPGYTEYPGVGHGAWTPTYTNPQVWDWLFAQHK